MGIVVIYDLYQPFQQDNELEWERKLRTRTFSNFGPQRGNELLKIVSDDTISLILLTFT